MFRLYWESSSAAPLRRGLWRPDWAAKDWGQLAALCSGGVPNSEASIETPFYGYAKKLELKNRLKDGALSPQFLKKRIQRRTLSPEQSLLAIDLLRKHKATRRDVRRLKRTQESSPGHAKRLAAYKPRPFAYNDPVSYRITRALAHQLRSEAAEAEGAEKEISDRQLNQVPEEENESIGSLEDLKLRFGTPRPPRPSRTADVFSLPLSRPNLAAFHLHKPQTLETLDLHFAEWFIGTTEAQMPFKVTPEGRPYFAIHHSDAQLFERIYSYLHFGHVDDIKQIWYVMDDLNLRRLMHLLNGNLFLESSRAAFADWVARYRALGNWKEPFEVGDRSVWRPQLNNKWLMGWIDSSYGLLAARLAESPTFPHFRINLKFWILSRHRSLLEHLQQIFGGGEIDQDDETYLRWTLKRRKEHVLMSKYCRMFRPYSLKNVNLERYERLVYYPIVKVKTQRAWEKLERLVQNLNTYERQLALGMTPHPYRQRYKRNAETQMGLARTGASKQDVLTFKRSQDLKDFPEWDTLRHLTLISETD